MTILFSKEQLEKLKPLETYFKTSVYQNFKRGTTKYENDLLTQVYAEATQKTLTGFNCGTCCLKNYQLVGKMYYASLEALEASEVKVVEVVEEAKEIEPVEQVVEKIIKRGRPKKVE